MGTRTETPPVCVELRAHQTAIDAVRSDLDVSVQDQTKLGLVVLLLYTQHYSAGWYFIRLHHLTARTRCARPLAKGL
jgi:hypothetical protein